MKATMWVKFSALMRRIAWQLKNLKAREVDARHGLLMSLAAIIKALLESVTACLESMGPEIDLETIPDPEIVATLSLAIEIVFDDILQHAHNVSYRKPELFGEGICSLISTTYELLLTVNYHVTVGRFEMTLKLINTW
jgi:hypothetical protein